MLPTEAQWHSKTVALYTSEDTGLKAQIASRLLFISESNDLPLVLSEKATSYRRITTLWVESRLSSIWLLDFENLEKSTTVLEQWQKKLGMVGGSYRLQADVAPVREFPVNAPSYQVSLDTNFHGANARLFLNQLYKISKLPSVGIKIAILDSGVDVNRSEFNKVKFIDSWDADFQLPGAVPEINQIHGNKIASLLWGSNKLNNTLGISHVAPPITPDAELIAIKSTSPWTSTLLDAFSRAVKSRADIINCSWILPFLHAPLGQYVSYVVNATQSGKNAIVITAESPQIGDQNALGLVSGVISVSSTDFRAQLANSSWSDNATVAVPGYFTVAKGNAESEVFTGTSAATALMTGLVAKLYYLHHELSSDDVIEILRTHSKLNTIRISTTNETKSYRELNFESFVAFLQSSEL